jgi:hypothetical protein
MAANYQISGAFHRASKTIIRAIKLSHPNQYECTFDANGYIVLPTLMPGDYYVQLAGISNCQISIDDTPQEHRFIGDDGWSDGCVTGTRARAAITSYFMRDLQFMDSYNLGTSGATPTGAAYRNGGVACYIPAETSGPWERGFKIIKEARHNKDIGRIGSSLSSRNNRVYVEILKELGRETGNSTSPLVYDLVAFECNVLNYAEQDGAEGLTEVTYELASVGEVYVGRYRSQDPIRFSDDWTLSDFRDEVTKESICRFGPEFTAILANTPPSAGVENVRYDHTTGQAWLLMSGLDHFGVGRTVRLYGLAFGCFSSEAYNSTYFPRAGDPAEFTIQEIVDRDVREYEVKQASYNHVTGAAVLTLDSTETIQVGTWVSLSGLRFSCLSSGQPIVKAFPQETAHSMFQVTSFTSATITVNVGTSDIAHTFVGGGLVRTGPMMRVNVGPSPMEHFYINGGTATIVGPLEANGTLTYNNADVQPRSTGILALA